MKRIGQSYEFCEVVTARTQFSNVMNTEIPYPSTMYKAMLINVGNVADTGIS